MKKVLIIEDNPMNMELISDILELNGFKVIQAVNAEDGIRQAKENSPDLILMDIQLPGMDGLEATKALKGDPNTNNIKVIAVTSHAMNGYEAKVKLAGCDGYITKPIDTRSLIEKINIYL